MIKLIAVLIAACCLTGCAIDIMDTKLLLKNESRDTIFYRFLYDTTLEVGYVNYLQDAPHSKLAPIDSVRPWIARKSDGLINNINSISKDSALHGFYFNTDTVKKYGWPNIIKYHKYITETYTVKQLDSLRWYILFDNIKH